MKIRRISRVVLLQLLSLLAIGVPMFWAGLYVWNKHHQMEAQLAQIEPRYARLLGILDRQADYKEINVKLQKQLAQMSYPASLDHTKAGNEAQQHIRGIFADNRLDIASIQVVSPKQVGEFDKIEIALRVEGSIKDIYEALLKLAEVSPLVLVESLSLQTVGPVRPASTQRLSALLALAVFRSRS